MQNLYKKFNNKNHQIDPEEAYHMVLKDSQSLDTLPDDLKKSPEFLSKLLTNSPSLFDEANKSFLEKDKELLKLIQTEPIAVLENRPFETLSLAHEKIKTRDFCLEMVKINPYNIRHIPNKFLYDSDFIEAALQGNGATVQFMPSFVKESENFALMAVKNNGFALKFFANNIINSREVLLSALDTKNFSLSQFNNPEEMCHDHEIAEKALKADFNAIKYFTKNNPLTKDKHFAIKMIPVNAKFFSLFDQETRHDSETLLQIVKGKSVEQILYIVSQEFTLYPKFFLFALDAYQKCLTEEEKQDNFGFYYYLHTSLFRERQKKFNIAYRRNLERKKQIMLQEEEKELERRKNAQNYILQESNSDPSLSAITENEHEPSGQIFKQEADSILVIEDNPAENKKITKSSAISWQEKFSGLNLLKEDLDKSKNNLENNQKNQNSSEKDNEDTSKNNESNNESLVRISPNNSVYTMQTAKDFRTPTLPVGSIGIVPPNNSQDYNASIAQTSVAKDDDNDSFAHLVNLANDLETDSSNGDDSNLSPSQTDSISESLNEPVSFIDESMFTTLDNNPDNNSISSSTFVDFQSYTSEQVKKANDEVNSIQLPSESYLPNRNHLTTVPDVTRHKDPAFVSPVSATTDDSEIDSNMSPAQNAAKRAFGDRNKSISQAAREEVDFEHRPIKRETTKKGSMSIFNFNKDKNSQ